MDSPARGARLREALPGFLGPALALALGLVAYRPLLFSELHLPDRYEVSGWFFRPDQFSPLPALAIAGWLLWRRRERLRGAPARAGALAAAPFLVLAGALFVWAHVTRAPHLLLPSLAASALALGAAARGGAGVRAVLLPSAVLLLGVPIPSPWKEELVWALQHWTADGTVWLLRALGQSVIQSGLLLRHGEQTFEVIEACSGLRGIQILTLVAIVVRELFADSGPRQWLLVAVAPWLGLALNVVRVAVIAASPDPESLGGGDRDHTPQGLAVVAIGTALLFSMGRALARPPRADAPRSGPGASGRALRAAPAALWLAALGLLSVAIPRALETEPAPFSRIGFPVEAAGWRGTELAADLLFLGAMPVGKSVYRRYEKPQRNRAPLTVDLFVGVDVADNAIADRLFSSKLRFPGPQWTIEEERPAPLWALGEDGLLVLASRASGSDHALLYTWRLRDRGAWREAVRSLLALESSPFRRDPPRVVVRLLTPLPGAGSLARETGRKVLDAFIGDFRQALRGL